MSPCVEDARSPCVEARGWRGGFGSAFKAGIRGTSVVMARLRPPITRDLPPPPPPPPGGDGSPGGMVNIFLPIRLGDAGKDAIVSMLLLMLAVVAAIVLLLSGRSGTSLLLLVPPSFDSTTDKSTTPVVKAISSSIEDSVNASDLEETGGVAIKSEDDGKVMARSEKEKSEYCMELALVELTVALLIFRDKFVVTESNALRVVVVLMVVAGVATVLFGCSCCVLVGCSGKAGEGVQLLLPFLEAVAWDF